MLSLKHFYIECARRAFRGRFRQVEKWTGSISLLGVIFLAFGSSVGGPNLARVVQIQAPTYFFIATFAGTVLVGFLVAPYKIYAEEYQVRLALERQREPKLRIALPGPEPGGVATAGSTSESYGGRRVTVTTGWMSHAIYLLCTNVGEVEAARCRARVLWASRESAGEVESAGIIESIELPWAKKDPEEHLTADIAPGDTVRIWLASVRQNGSLWVFRDKDELPINYQQVFGELGHHKVLVQVDGANVASTQLLLSIITEEAKPPEGSGSWTPKATVVMLDQGRPPLTHPEMPPRVGDTAILVSDTASR